MDLPETAEDRMRRRIDLLAEYEAVGQAVPEPFDPTRPTPAPLNRHQRRRYAALSRTARTR